MADKKKKKDVAKKLNLKNFLDNDGSGINKYTKAYLEAKAREKKDKEVNPLAIDHTADEWWKIIKEDMKLKV